MCDSGRNDRHSSSCAEAEQVQQVVTLEVMLPWVSITPFMSPVVPEV